MIKIFSTDKVRELDKYTIQNEPISSIDLVERAATVFTSEFCRRYSKQTRIIVFAGQGNNGADALAIARMLTDAGYRVETYLFNPTMRLSDDCELNKQRLLHMEKIEFTEVVDDFVPPELEERDVVIDGLFGSGLNRPLTGGFAAMVRYKPVECDRRCDRHSFRPVRRRQPQERSGRYYPCRSDADIRFSEISVSTSRKCRICR